VNKAMHRIIKSLPLLILVGCSTLSTPNGTPLQSGALLAQRDLQNPTKAQVGGGFFATEAKQLLEFCIELNNQDDRNKAAINSSIESPFNAKPGTWQIEYDSRNPGNKQWNVRGSNDVNDPKKNGIKPFNNAWVLLKNLANPKQYAIAIRGTVGEKSSILDDALVTTIPAYAGIDYPRGRHLPIAFAATPYAELHLGFASAAFALLFDKERGILSALHKANLPSDAQLFVTGHSQGAAIATILHSFLYYAITDPSDRYKLDMHLQNKDAVGIQLKSYVFAQPKPGNLQYAEDFGRITKDMAYVINNDLDPVPQIPLSLQTPSEAMRGVVTDNTDTGDFFESLFFWKESFKIAALDSLKDHIAKDGEEKVAKLFEHKKVDLDTSYFNADTIPKQAKASSLNYTLVGELIPLFGAAKGGDIYPIKDKPDALLQHHATSYRLLIQRQIPE
jgi:Lipase (class 3)